MLRSQQRLVELAFRSGLIEPDATDLHVCDNHHLAFDRRPGNPAQHSQLTDVGEDIGEWSLEQYFERGRARQFCREGVVQLLKRFEEPRDIVIPCAWSYRMPSRKPLFAPHLTKCPFDQVRHVGQNLCGSARGLGDAKGSKRPRGIAKRLASAVSDRSENVAEELSGMVSLVSAHRFNLRFLFSVDRSAFHNPKDQAKIKAPTGMSAPHNQAITADVVYADPTC